MKATVRSGGQFHAHRTAAVTVCQLSTFLKRRPFPSIVVILLSFVRYITHKRCWTKCNLLLNPAFLIAGWFLGMIDDQYIHGRFLRFKLKPQCLNSRKDVDIPDRVLGSVRWGIWGVRKTEVVLTRETREIQDRAIYQTVFDHPH